MKIHLIIILALIFFLPALVRAQQTDGKTADNKDLVQFSGAVVTGDSLRPVSFTHIIDRSTGFWTIADFYGYYSFVARKGDTISFSAVGFKKAYVTIPDTIRNNRYVMFQVMATDTIYLNETVIYAWPSKEEFRMAFITLDLPDDDLEIARKNLERYELAVRTDQISVPMDGSMNYHNYIDQTVSKLYYKGQTQPISLLNPFAWAEFIKAWEEGKFKRKKQ